MNIKQFTSIALYVGLIFTLSNINPIAINASEIDKLNPDPSHEENMPESDYRKPGEAWKEGESRGDRVTNPTMRDSDLEQKVKEVLKPYRHIGVSAEKGIVTLTGEVGSVEEEAAVVSRVRAVQGVKSVNAHLTVR